MYHSKDEILHILLADDDQDDCLLFTEAAGKLSCPFFISLAEDGEQLLNFLNNRILPDIIFLDLNMPRLSGRECLKTIRANPEYDNIPVIIYSTSSASSDIDNCYKNGASLYVIKPDYFADILVLLQKVLSIDWGININKIKKKSFVLKCTH